LLNVSASVEPAQGDAFEMESAGSGITGSAGLDEGHDVMKGEASEYTALNPRGVSKGPSHGCCLSTAEDTQPTWRCSTARMD